MLSSLVNIANPREIKSPQIRQKYSHASSVLIKTIQSKSTRKDYSACATGNGQPWPCDWPRPKCDEPLWTIEISLRRNQRGTARLPKRISSRASHDMVLNRPISLFFQQFPKTCIGWAPFTIHVSTLWVLLRHPGSACVEPPACRYSSSELHCGIQEETWENSTSILPVVPWIIPASHPSPRKNRLLSIASFFIDNSHCGFAQD